MQLLTVAITDIGTVHYIRTNAYELGNSKKLHIKYNTVQKPMHFRNFLVQDCTENMCFCKL
jgi:hypothetical protein